MLGVNDDLILIIAKNKNDNNYVINKGVIY